MGAVASVNNRYDYSESTEILPEAVESALKVLEDRGAEKFDSKGNVLANHLAVPFYRKHPFYDYRIDKKLGDGAFSSVYKATQVTKTGQLVMNNFSLDENSPDWRPLRFAIKEIMLEDLTNQQLTNVQREVQFLSQLNHPDVVRMHAVYSTVPPDLKSNLPVDEAPVMESIDLIRDRNLYTQLYIVLEYLQGGELLQAVCARKRYNEDDARDLMLQIFEGICYIHSRGVIHRDIKPENLILSSKSENNKVKIVDFGFAMLSDDADAANETKRSSGEGAALKDFKEKTDFLCGTPGYMAPEVLKSRLYSTKCDMWAAGVVMYILLSGTMPFSVDDTKSQMRGQYSFSPSRWITVTDAAKDLVSSLLRVNHNSRLSAEQALEHPWMKKLTRVGEIPSKAVFDPIKAGLVEPVAALSPVPVINLVTIPSIKPEPNTSPLMKTSFEILTSVGSHNSAETVVTKLSVGDLTHNLPALRQMGAAKRLKRGMKAVQSAIRFKSFGQARERRRSESQSSLEGESKEDAAAAVAEAAPSSVAMQNVDADFEAGFDTKDVGSAGKGGGEENERREKQRAYSDGGSGSDAEISSRYEDNEDSLPKNQAEND